jgi:hypothetical protein
MRSDPAGGDVAGRASIRRELAAVIAGVGRRARRPAAGGPVVRRRGRARHRRARAACGERGAQIARDRQHGAVGADALLELEVAVVNRRCGLARRFGGFEGAQCRTDGPWRERCPARLSVGLMDGGGRRTAPTGARMRSGARPRARPGSRRPCAAIPAALAGVSGLRESERWRIRRSRGLTSGAPVRG